MSLREENFLAVYTLGWCFITILAFTAFFLWTEGSGEQAMGKEDHFIIWYLHGVEDI